jgi:predicted alpha/beta superfamily hydrolase
VPLVAAKRKQGTFIELGTFSAGAIVNRRARVYVPTRTREKPSVLVMADGQNVFGDEGSFAGGWYAHEAAERVAIAMRPVIVAIDHGGPERIAELGAPGSGDGAAKLGAFVELVVDRVLPALHARLQLGYGPASHYVCGSSMGGLFALYMHFRRPEVFGGAIAMSPSLFFQRRGIFDFVATEPNPYRSRIWLDAGAKEAGGRLVPLVGSMGQSLENRGWRPATGDLRVTVHVDPKGGHSEASWKRRLPKALRFAFGP